LCLKDPFGTPDRIATLITPAYIQLLARYNDWQNENVYSAANTLSDDLRRQDGGAFFGSIHRTLSHIFWGDSVWMHRIAQTPMPNCSIAASPDFIADWAELCTARASLDAVIQQWAANVSEGWLKSDISWYSGATQREWTKPVSGIVVHFFNHQTHHRGQVHALLTRFGARPSDTDLVFMT
jgi:uncharacterized damage-inducible protein DinB